MTLPKVISEQTVCDAPAENDVRGPFGYGRPAHGSDPHATYGFSPGGPVQGQPGSEPAAAPSDRQQPGSDNVAPAMDAGAQDGGELSADKPPHVRFGIKDIRYA